MASSLLCDFTTSLVQISAKLKEIICEFRKKQNGSVDGHAKVFDSRLYGLHVFLFYRIKHPQIFSLTLLEHGFQTVYCPGYPPVGYNAVYLCPSQNMVLDLDMVLQSLSGI